MEQFEDRKILFLFLSQNEFQLCHYSLAFCDCKKHTKSCKLNIALIFLKLPSILYIYIYRFLTICGYRPFPYLELDQVQISCCLLQEYNGF